MGHFFTVIRGKITAAGVFYIGVKFIAGVVDTCGKFTADVSATLGKDVTTGVVDTSSAP
jgi:hypothetical protein